MSIAIVTGASSGMGEEFCRRIDGRGYDCIWMIARNTERMERIAEGLRTPCKVIECDLTDREGLDRLSDIVSSERPDIGLLVCNAGVGYIGDIDVLSVEDQRRMVDLNITALVSMIPPMVGCMGRGSNVIILCSLSAYLPMPHLAVYSSTKAFVRHYCDAIRGELEPKGIHVLEVSPGWVDTGFIDNCKGGMKVPDKVFNGMVSREDVVSKAMSDMDKGRKRSQVGLRTRGISFLGDHFRGFALRTWKGYWR